MERLIRVSEYAELFALTDQAVRARIRKGKLAAKKVDGEWCIPDDVLLDHLKNRDRMMNRSKRRRP